MRNFAIRSGPGILTVTLAVCLGYFVLTPPKAEEIRPAAPEIVAHSTTCTVCRLSLFGHDGQASRFGPEEHVIGAHAVSATQ